MATTSSSKPRVDQALSFHRVAERKYELSGLRTGSVRDQIMRAYLLAERLVATKELQRGSKLLVIGGGACGATLALKACSDGVNVTLVDREESPFTKQSASPRYLHPNEYDWPHDHCTIPDMDWNVGPAPWSASKFPLNYTAAPASNIAGGWMLGWDMIANQAAIGTAGTLSFFPGIEGELIKIDPARGGQIDATYLAAPAHPITGSYEVVVSCVGFIEEKVAVPEVSSGDLMEGPRFWDGDDLCDPDLGTTRSGPFNVLVSGSGDGAQQDIQRLLTGQCASELLNTLDGIGIKPSASDWKRILLADDKGRRSHIWSNPLALNAEDMEKWDDAYRWLARKLVVEHMTQHGRTEIERLIRDDINLSWLIGGQAMTFGFSLNKYLTHIIMEMYSVRTGRPIDDENAPDSIMIWGQQLQYVDAMGGHACDENCYKLPHKVILKGSPTAVANKALQDIEFDVIVVRHGVKQKPLFDPAPVSEQLIPYATPQ